MVWKAGPPLPAPVSNNAVAAVPTDDGVSVFSFMGMDSTRGWDGVTDVAYRWDVGSDAWRTLTPVPGPGRLASTAQRVGDRIYLFGGYTVAEDGTERSVPDVNVYDPATGGWSRGADMPVPVDDAVSGVWRDSLIFLVSGWHDDGNVDDVQIYDPATDRWTAATPIAGTPVFGHTGTVVGDLILYSDGVQVVDGDPRFAMDTAVWQGRIDPADPTDIDWSRIPRHPDDPPLYRGAGGSMGALAFFVGGTDNPYNYDGIGYDGEPSEPMRSVLVYSPMAEEWRHLAAPPVATMDHRNLATAGRLLFLVGGMEEGQTVSAKIWYAELEALAGGIW